MLKFRTDSAPPASAVMSQPLWLSPHSRTLVMLSLCEMPLSLAAARSGAPAGAAGAAVSGVKVIGGRDRADVAGLVDLAHRDGVLPANPPMIGENSSGKLMQGANLLAKVINSQSA